MPAVAVAVARVSVTPAPPLSIVPPPLRDFVLKVSGEYAIVIEASSIEDAQALALADEWAGRATAHLQEVGNDNQLDFEVGR